MDTFTRARGSIQRWYGKPAVLILHHLFQHCEVDRRKRLLVFIRRATLATQARPLVCRRFSRSVVHSLRKTRRLVCAEEVPPSAQKFHLSRVNIRQYGHSTYFKIEDTTRMEEVFDMYAQRNGVSASSLRFKLHGHAVWNYDTPMTLNLQDADVIDCSLKRP